MATGNSAGADAQRGSGPANADGEEGRSSTSSSWSPQEASIAWPANVGDQMEQPSRSSRRERPCPLRKLHDGLLGATSGGSSGSLRQLGTENVPKPPRFLCTSALRPAGSIWQHWQVKSSDLASSLDEEQSTFEGDLTTDVDSASHLEKSVASEMEVLDREVAFERGGLGDEESVGESEPGADFVDKTPGMRIASPQCGLLQTSEARGDVHGRRVPACMLRRSEAMWHANEPYCSDQDSQDSG